LLVLLSVSPALAAVGAPIAFASANGEPIRGYLAKPPGAGPFPAVVLLHSCLGLPSNRRGIEQALTSAGFATLFVDEFTTRGLKETCSVDFPQLLPDAFGALGALKRVPGVDVDRVAIVGFSQGADGALMAAVSPQGARGGLAFRAAAAFYPPCANQAGQRVAAPTLIVVGEKDAVTPAADCQTFAASQPDAVRLSVLPDAGHCFDDPAFAGGKRVLGMTLAYDPKAARHGMAELVAFLRENLAH
jgi:dienelactone hydrolase